MYIIGKEFLVDFETAKAMLYIQSETSLTFKIIERPDGDNITETVETKMTEIRPQLYMITWIEKSGKTITQIHDYEHGVIYSKWTLPGGEFVNKKGTLKRIDK